MKEDLDEQEAVPQGLYPQWYYEPATPVAFSISHDQTGCLLPEAENLFLSKTKGMLAVSYD